MAWIESNQELGRHPKTRRLARLLGVSLPDAVGRLQYLWWWALDFAPDGDLSRYDADDIADAVLWEGDAAQCVEALVSAGFLDVREDGLAIHDWVDYAGRLVERREQEKAYKARKVALYSDARLCKTVRDRDGDTCQYCGRTVDWKDRRGAQGGTYDHVDPNGANELGNIVVACRACNAKKGGRTPEEAGMRLLPGALRPAAPAASLEKQWEKPTPEKGDNKGTGRFNADTGRNNANISAITVPNRTLPYLIPSGDYTGAREGAREEPPAAPPEKQGGGGTAGGAGPGSKDAFFFYAKDDRALLGALRDFEALRKSLRKPLTAKGKELICATLDKLPPGDRVAALEQSVRGGYADVYAPKGSPPGKGGGKRDPPGERAEDRELERLSVAAMTGLGLR